MTNNKLKQWDKLADLAAAVNAGKTKASDLVKESLELINQAKDYNAVLWTAEERAKERAAEIDQQVADGKNAGRLAGVPFIAKDNFLTFGVQTTAASNILMGFEAPYQATVVQKLEDEGAILVAKANLDSFAHGASTEHSDFGVTKNPYDVERVPGGSSGGSAAAVALGLAPFAIGSDTGGSIRQPASFTGTFGFKPTYGSLGRYGVVAMASSTDVAGPLATSTDDAALVYDVMAGRDEHDSTTIERYDDDFAKLKTPQKLKIGVIKEHLSDGLSDEVRQATEAAIELLKQTGHEIVEVALPELDLALACYYIVMPAEVTSNLARYDGIKYGLSERADGKDLDDLYSQTRATGFSSEVKRRIMIGNYVLSSGYYDAYYKKAQQVRTLLIDGFNKAFTDVDLLVGPTTPTTAFKIGENTNDPIQMYLADIMTVSMSLAGLPAISVPVAKDGLPVGFQITGPQKGDRQVLELAKQLETSL